MKFKAKSMQSGFTLVELIVVIIILAILGAVALPKFMDVTSKAQISAVKGAGGGLGAGIALAHAQWVANGSSSADTDGVEGFGAGDINTNADGWPVGTDAAFNNDQDCIDIWNGVMQGPPSISDTAGTVDYVAAKGTGGTANVCTYTYHGGQATAPQPDGSNDMTITYDTSTGTVQVNNASE